MPSRYNSFYALWQTTHHFPWSRVWIDAICINQLDLVEKTAQVKMMYEIYAGATQVLACIGPSDEHSDTVLQATENMDMFVQNLPKDLSWTPRDLNAWNPPLDEAAAAQFLEHYSEFSMRPYFTRVWVVQEVAAGRVNARVLCGQRIILWLDLAELSCRMYRAHLFAPDGPYKSRFNGRINNIHCSMTNRKRGYPVYLEYIRELQCEDLRDRIYSTNALVDWTSLGQRPPVPDYQISLLELAIKLVDRIVDTDFENVVTIAQTLDLLNPSRISQVLEELRTHRHLERSHKAPGVPYRKWSTIVDTVQMVQQDAMGHSNIAFDEGWATSTASSERTNFADLSGLSKEMLAAGRPFPHVDRAFVSFAGERALGDIIIRSDWFDLVLRPHDDGESFVVVGNAFMTDCSDLATKAPFVDECDCHQRLWPQVDLTCSEYIRIAIELSGEEALATVIRRKALRNGDCAVLEYLESENVGITKAGSRVWDVTAEKIESEHNIGLAPRACDVHRAGDYYWRHQKFLWYSALMGTGCILAFPDEDTIYPPL